MSLPDGPRSAGDRPALSPMGEMVRRADPDRFLTVLFAPPDRREALFTLYAFNAETARARTVAREPMMALIRLQWWREVVEGTHKQHETASPLTALLEQGTLRPEDLLPIIEAREIEAIATVADWRNWLLAGPGTLAMTAGRLLGAETSRLRELGAGYAAAGVLRSIVPLARAGYCLLPAELLNANGLDPDTVIADPASTRLHPVIAALANEGRKLLGDAARPGRALAAALPAVFGRRDLRQTPSRLLDPQPRGLGDRLAVSLAALTGRV